MYAQELTNTFAGQKKSNLIISSVVKYIFGFDSGHDLKQKECYLDRAEKGIC